MSFDPEIEPTLHALDNELEARMFPETVQDALKKQIRFALGMRKLEVLHDSLSLRAQRGRDRLEQLASQHGILEDAKIPYATIMRTATETNTDAIMAEYQRLTLLNTYVLIHGGEMVTWLTESGSESFINLGILRQRANLVVDPEGNLSIPLSASSRSVLRSKPNTADNPYETIQLGPLWDLPGERIAVPVTEPLTQSALLIGDELVNDMISSHQNNPNHGYFTALLATLPDL